MRTPELFECCPGERQPALGLVHVGFTAAAGLGAAPNSVNHRFVLAHVLLGQSNDLSGREYVEVGLRGAKANLLAGVEVPFDRGVGTLGRRANPAAGSRRIVDQLTERNIALGAIDRHALTVGAVAAGRPGAGRGVVGPSPRRRHTGVDGRAQAGALLLHAFLRRVIAGTRGEDRGMCSDRDLDGVG